MKKKITVNILWYVALHKESSCKNEVLLYFNLLVDIKTLTLTKND